MGTIIQGNGALPEIWVLNDSSEGNSGARDGSYNSFPPSFARGSGEAPEEKAHSDGSGNGRGGYEPYIIVNRSGGAPKDGRWGGYEPQPYYRSGYEPNPYYRSGGAHSDGSGYGKGGYEPEPYYRSGGAPSNGRWGYKPYYHRSGGASSNGSGNGRGDYKPEPYYRSGGPKIISTNADTNTNTGATVIVNSRGGYEPYCRSGYEPKPYYRSGGAPKAPKGGKPSERTGEKGKGEGKEPCKWGEWKTTKECDVCKEE